MQLFRFLVASGLLQMILFPVYCYKKHPNIYMKTNLKELTIILNGIVSTLKKNIYVKY